MAGWSATPCSVSYFTLHPVGTTNLGMMIKRDQPAVTKLKMIVVTKAPAGDEAFTDQPAKKIHARPITAPMHPKSADAHQPGNRPIMP